jgi:hypothetical protein
LSANVASTRRGIFAIHSCQLSWSGIMIDQKGIAETRREHVMRAAEDEMEKVVRKEIVLQQAERIERAKKLRLPALGADLAL